MVPILRPHSTLAHRTPEEFRLTLALAATTGNGHNINAGLSL